MPYSSKTHKFKEHHLKVKCPICFAMIGSRCRGDWHGEMIAGSHRERAKNSKQFAPKRVRTKTASISLKSFIPEEKPIHLLGFKKVRRNRQPRKPYQHINPQEVKVSEIKEL